MQLQYFDKIKKLIEEVEIKEEKSIEEAINLFVEAIENNHSIFTFGASHAGIMSEEMYYRAGGLVLINPIFGREIMLDTEPISHTSVMERMEGYGTSLAMNTPIKEGDVVITHSVSGRNPVTLEIALEAKKEEQK